MTAATIPEFPYRFRTRILWRVAFMVTALALCLSTPAWAHIGPPYPIMQNRKIGPLTVDVWSNPDVGVGSFFVIIKPPPRGAVPSDIRVQVAVQPVSGRLPEMTYNAWREKLRDRVEFKTTVPFDKEEMWKVRILLSSVPVTGETDTSVPVTPTLARTLELIALPAALSWHWIPLVQSGPYETKPKEADGTEEGPS